MFEKKVHRGRLWKIFGSEQFLRGMWECFTLKRAEGKKDSSGRCSRKTTGKPRSVATGAFLQIRSGTSQKKCGYRLRSPDDAPCLHRNESLAIWKNFKEECRKGGVLCEWTFARLQESHEKVAVDYIGGMSTAQEILRKKHGLLEADGRSHFVVRLPALHLFPFG